MRRIAVAVHDVEPATFDTCVWIRDWLFERGIDRATLLVIPACRSHRFQDSRPEMVGWLRDWRRAGDAVAQHGFRHVQDRPGTAVRGRLGRWSGSGAAEFAGLDAEGTRTAADAGWRVLARAGIAPAGFVAPAYAYTPELRRHLAAGYSWWAGLWKVQVPGASLAAPALMLGTSRLPREVLSPSALRARARVAGPLLRLDVHPTDVDRPRHLAALERVLELASGREPVTYDRVAAELSAFASSRRRRTGGRSARSSGSGRTRAGPPRAAGARPHRPRRS